VSDSAVLWTILIGSVAGFALLYYLADFVIWMVQQRADHWFNLSHRPLGVGWLCDLFFWLLYTAILLLLILISAGLLLSILNDIKQWLNK
jgi:hypothetical protein